MLPKKLTPEELKSLLTRGLDRSTISVPVDETHLLPLIPKVAHKTLAQTLVEQKYASGDVIFHEGESGEVAYFIWAGQAIVIKGDLQTPTILGYRGPGDILGEMALLEHRPRSASVIALTDLRLLKIHKDDFIRLLSDDPALSINILATLSGRLRTADTIREATTQVGQRLAEQVSELKSHAEELLALQEMRQETVDLIIHDLRNPLSTLINVLELLSITLPPEVLDANQDLLNVGRSAYTRMKQLIDTLLDASRLEAGEAYLDIHETDLGSLLHNVILAMTPAANRKNLTLRTQLEAALPVAMVDAERIERVLYNLLDNAIKHTPHGSITVAVKHHAGKIVISVNDTGPGIPVAARKRLFDRFVQLKGEEKRRQGFGLGLRFCYLAVHAHGGEIWIETGDNGIGSKFVFTLPLQS